MRCLQYTRPSALPLPGQAVDAPLVLMCNGSEQRDRQWMEVEFFENVVGQIGLLNLLVDTVERFACGFYR